MSSGDEAPAWRDPLLPSLEPTGTGSGAYVEQPPPRANPMTVEGEIAALGEMARGAANRAGLAGMLAKVVIALALVAFTAGLIAQLVHLFA
jgi:hypothetical protein